MSCPSLKWTDESRPFVLIVATSLRRASGGVLLTTLVGLVASVFVTGATVKRERQIMRRPKAASKDLPWDGSSFRGNVRRGIFVFTLITKVGFDGWVARFIATPEK